MLGAQRRGPCAATCPLMWSRGVTQLLLRCGPTAVEVRPILHDVRPNPTQQLLRSIRHPSPEHERNAVDNLYMTTFDKTDKMGPGTSASPSPFEPPQVAVAEASGGGAQPPRGGGGAGGRPPAPGAGTWAGQQPSAQAVAPIMSHWAEGSGPGMPAAVRG